MKVVEHGLRPELAEHRPPERTATHGPRRSTTWGSHPTTTWGSHRSTTWGLRRSTTWGSRRSTTWGWSRVSRTRAPSPQPVGVVAREPHSRRHPRRPAPPGVASPGQSGIAT
jgi:hypothetical protein